MLIRRLTLAFIFLCFLQILIGCSGNVTPKSLVGNWKGTYANNVVGVGKISARFFIDQHDYLQMSYDLQNGEVAGYSLIELDGNDFSFGGDPTGELIDSTVSGYLTSGLIRLTTFVDSAKGTVNSSSNEIEGIIIINYALTGKERGQFKLQKVR